MARNGLGTATNDCEWLGMAVNAANGCEYCEWLGMGWECLRMARNGLEWMRMGMARNGWEWLGMDGNAWKWIGNGWE
jgi:hypothetical protein